MTKKRLILISILIIFGIIAGCSNNGIKDNMQVKINNSSDLDLGNGKSWCDEGSKVDISSPDGEFKLEIIGIEDNGEYQGMCHMRYEIGTAAQEGVIDYYVDEAGNGFQIMNINGQQTKTVWTTQ